MVPQAPIVPSKRNTMLQGTYYLVSHHHTVVYVDDDSKHLRHAPFAAARPNLIFEIEGDRARAMVIGASLPDRAPIALEREETKSARSMTTEISALSSINFLRARPQSASGRSISRPT